MGCKQHMTCIQVFICTISVSLTYIWSHVEDSMALYVSIKPFINEKQPVNYRKIKEYVPEKISIGALGENKTLMSTP